MALQETSNCVFAWFTVNPLLHYCGTLSGGCLNPSFPSWEIAENYCKQSFSHSMACGYVSLQIPTAQWPVSIHVVLKRHKNPSRTDECFTLAENILTFRLYRRCLMCLSLTWLMMLKRDFSWQGSITYFSVWGGFLVCNRNILQLCVPNKTELASVDSRNPAPPSCFSLLRLQNTSLWTQSYTYMCNQICFDLSLCRFCLFLPSNETRPSHLSLPLSPSFYFSLSWWWNLSLMASSTRAVQLREWQLSVHSIFFSSVAVGKSVHLCSCKWI